VIWQLLIYRLPATPSRARVAAWRELRRLGALPLQQSVAAVPELGDLPARLDAIQRRIESEGGTAYRFRLLELSPEQEAALRRDWNELRTQEYAEIVEECETKFEREVDFELFRGNLTGAEAEELEADLDKIKAWLRRVRARDLFDAEGRGEAEAAIARCERALEDFVERVYLAEQAEGPSLERPVQLPWGEGVPASPKERRLRAKQIVRLPPPKKAKPKKGKLQRAADDPGEASEGSA
jgi:hypothetical protein